MEVTEEAQIPHASLSGKKCCAASRIGQELDWGVPGVEMNLNLFNGSLGQTVNESNGWSDPSGKGFMVRSCTYDQDSLKVSACSCLWFSCVFTLLLVIDDDHSNRLLEIAVLCSSYV
jgi:hypothetical protein